MKRIHSYAFLLLTAALPCQTPRRWIPAGMNIRATEGNYDYHFPFNPTEGRFQNIISKTRMGALPLMISGIRLRPDGTRTSYRPWPAQKVTHLDLFVANHPGPRYADRYSYSGNRVNDYTLVLKAAKLSLPAAPLPSKTPVPFSSGVDIPFSKPFLYKGQSGFMVEFVRKERVYQYNRWYIDAHLQKKYVPPPTGTGAYPVYYGTKTYIGTGCPTSFWTSLEATYPGGAIVTYGEAQGANLPVIVSLGTSSTGFAPGIALPFDLTPLGAPGCHLYSNWIGLKIGVTANDPKGTYRMKWGNVPRDPIYAKATIYSQAFALDKPYNALGMRVSRTRKLVLGVGFPSDIDGVTFHSNGAGSTANDRPASWYPRVIVMELY